ncbi:hypothetical protein FPOAC1_006685 [Fusarium poae]|uniref:Uncharacterized protein n=1 Tax=Fusarium poae TaxID=36050 RepID=A0A1B8AYL4_FUSPO|nr:hypothetical protein FPOAC1_006685 [Fusarium poae]KAG8673373.1 hypothetical protein FPOAC1_006685 [Fusarium poae]OBS25569.1 hypothetical protein FPOA_06103 [Fusarium poae]
MPNHSSQYSPAARLKNCETGSILPIVVGVSIVAWVVFLFLTYIRYIDLLISKWRTVYLNWRAGGVYPNSDDRVEGRVGEQSPLVKKVQKKVRFSDEKTVVPGARDPIPS